MFLEHGQAWSEPGLRQINENKPFSLDWSDDEGDLVPMKIDFNSSNKMFSKLKQYLEF